MPPTTKSTVIARLEKLVKTDIRYLVKGGTWLMAGFTSSLLLSFALAIIFGHFAAKDTYGNYKYALSLASLIGSLSLTGLGTALTRSAAKGFDGALRQAFRLNNIWSIGFVLVSLGTSGYYLWQGNQFLSLALCLIAICYPFLNGFSLFDPFLVGKKDFKRNTLYFIINNAIPTLAIIATLFINQRAIVLVSVFLITSTLSSALFYLLTLRQTKNNNPDPDLLHFSAHLSIMGIVGAIANKIDSIMVFAFLGPVQLATYSYAIALPEQIKAVVKNIVPLSMPKFTERSLAEIRHSIWRRIFALFIVLFLMIAAYLIVAPWLYKIFFPIYIDAVEYSRLYALSLLFSFITPLASALQAHKATRALHIINNTSSIILIITLPILAYFYGIIGIIGSQFIYRSCNAALTIWQFNVTREIKA